MSRFFPHTAYAEDQPRPYAILTAHVLARGFTAGSLVGLAAAGVRQAVPAWRRPGPLAAAVLRSSSTGSLVGVGLMGLALGGRMYGRSRIEWQDRSWRLLENRGQVEVDDWTYVGMAAGAAAAAAATGHVRALGLRAVVGGAGAGSVVGMIGCLAWRQGLNGGRFPEKGREGDL
ncbi:uncharacterized protein UV8b_06640 [Ustilaginoidea virens]|uniref:Uncharacterized protein n=1 Tax=Ustilaginoidea virens TaxID=1159556 RepID=A0A8E5HVH8_USTVR|nr:uncharacterized protein UV8b_06640 [Ustilaginoidea virens]QUC22399.1 hypothetical protein UV8b_06640 [Ustilaginoidea virens]